MRRSGADLPSFDLTDVGAMKPGMLGQDLLRPTAGEAQKAQFLGEGRADAGGSFLG